MAKTKQQLRCYHCGDACSESTALHYDDKVFCCQGCEAAYRLLQDNGLCDYYKLSEGAGVKIEHDSWEDKYAFLDSEEVVNSLLDYRDEQLAVVRLYIPTIHCSSCIWLLEHLPRLQEGIEEARLFFSKKVLQLHYRPDVLSLKEVAVLLARLGYAPLIRMDNAAAEEKRPTTDYRLYWKLGLTGFCAGNIMLLSFPEYFSLQEIVEGQYLRFFQYLNAALALPAFFYGGSDYLRGARHSLRNFFSGKDRQLSLDVPLALGMWALLLRSAYDTFVAGQAGYWDSLAGLVFFLLIGKWIQNKTYEHLSFERDYRSYFPLAVQRKSPQGYYRSVPIRQVEKGDVLRLHHEEVLPCDSVLLSGKAYLDYSFVTGESRPVEAHQGERLYAGAKVIGQAIEVQVEKSVEQSYLVSLWDNFRKERPAQRRFVDVVAQYFTFATLTLAVLSSVIWYWLSPDSPHWWMVGSAVLIVACPCALSLSTPFTLGAAMTVLAKRGLFVRNQEIIERLREVQHIVMDKTGTLTESSHSDVEWQGQPLNHKEKQLLASLVAQSSHPLSRSIAQLLGNIPLLEVSNFREQKGAGIAAEIAGDIVRMGSAAFVGLSAAPQSAESYVYVAINTRIAGFFRVRPVYRQGLGEVLRSLRTMGYRLSLLSGDHAHSAKLFSPFFKAEEMHLEQSPHDKSRFIESCQQAGEKVLMLGDGLNDAGALQQSDVGMAISEEIHAFSPACDALLRADAFEQLPHILRYARASRYVVYTNLALSLIYNLIGISWAVSGALSPVIAAILMPLSSVSVVVVATLGAQWLGFRHFSKINPKKQ
ncbi:MAG: ATPase [Thermonema sp.]|uniref:heavy metal translocating P-type ATPase n=1 Tax=Thermonema sp. TaxID=2231181 RepID=UPI0021DDDF6D|nr:heavy metal translocating P-type ATPase [Thermonema sp.]GIV39270.1 MAG: ATPase [Thermonema sp.]